MCSSARLVKGFTFLELLVSLAILAVFGFLFLERFGHENNHLVQGDIILCMNNARQIHLACVSMVEDGATNKNTALGWPGDLKAAGHISTLADYVNFLVHNGYLSVSELHIFTNLGYEDRGKLSLASNGVLVPAFREEYSALKVYLVKKGDPADTVFLTSKNYTYNTPLNNPKAKPFGDKGFVVCNKGGDAHVFKKQQAQDLPVIGKLPGEGSVESAENCLNPGPPAPPK